MNDRQRLDLEGLIKKLRSVTIAVQIMPFIYTLLYLVCMVFYLFADESTLTALDTLFYVSPLVVAEFLVLSYALRLCKWHRMACLLPLIPQIMVGLDSTFLFFSGRVAVYSIVTLAIMSALLLIAAYNVFFR